jgi:uncharacterized protein YecE (DUF72 family)
MKDFRIGCSGYYYKEWKEIFYPKGMAAKDWFQFYSTQFNTLEINSTFYRTPIKKSFENWYTQSPDNFLFSVKAPKFITHLKKFDIEKDDLNIFYDLVVDGLKHKIGCFLFQMPPSFSYTKQRLDLILEHLNPTLKNVVEFRHISWWQQEVFDVLREHKITFCGQSYPGSLPEHIVVNNDLVYYRFHGKPVLYKSLYEASVLEDILVQIGSKNKEIFIYFNNTWGESALINAKQMQEMIT